MVRLKDSNSQAQIGNPHLPIRRTTKKMLLEGNHLLKSCYLSPLGSEQKEPLHPPLKVKLPPQLITINIKFGTHV